MFKTFFSVSAVGANLCFGREVIELEFIKETFEFLDILGKTGDLLFRRVFDSSFCSPGAVTVLLKGLRSGICGISMFLFVL